MKDNIQQLADRFAVLRRSAESAYDDLKSEIKKRDALEKRWEVAFGEERDAIESQLVRQEEVLDEVFRRRRATLKRAAQMDLKLDGHRRLRDLQESTTELTARKREKVERLRQVVVQYEAKRSEFVETEVNAKITRNSAESVINPEKFMTDFERQFLREDTEPEEVTPELRKSKNDLAESVKRTDQLAKNVRLELDRLWSRQAMIRDEILTIEITLAVQKNELQSLERTRKTWDRDIPDGKD